MPDKAKIHYGGGVRTIELFQVSYCLDNERLGVTPKISEFLYTQDTKRLYIGDGSTLGGISAGVGDWLFGAGIPASELGRDADYYLNTIASGTGDFYKKIEGSWVKQGEFFIEHTHVHTHGIPIILIEDNDPISLDNAYFIAGTSSESDKTLLDISLFSKGIIEDKPHGLITFNPANNEYLWFLYPKRFEPIVILYSKNEITSFTSEDILYNDELYLIYKSDFKYNNQIILELLSESPYTTDGQKLYIEDGDIIPKIIQVTDGEHFSGSYLDLTNTPTIPDQLLDLASDPTHRTVTDIEKIYWNNKSNFSGSYNDLTNKPTIPAAQVQSDWNASGTVAEILNKPSLFSGDYNDLISKPTIFTLASSGGLNGVEETAARSDHSHSAINPSVSFGTAHIFDYYSKNFNETLSGSFVKLLETRVPVGGTATSTLYVYITNMVGGVPSVVLRIYKNGVAYGTQRTLAVSTVNSGSWVETLTFSGGDYIQIYGYSSPASYIVSNTVSLTLQTAQIYSYNSCLHT